jgi:enterochelin esterase-like enzyme
MRRGRALYTQIEFFKFSLCHHLAERSLDACSLRRRKEEAMNQFSYFTIVIAVALLAGCSGPEKLPTLSPECHSPSTHTMDRVFFPETGEEHVITIYLPPCYDENGKSAYPVVYWTNGDGSDLFDTADRFIRQGDTAPFIMVMVGIDPNKGSGADVQIIDDVVPYIDAVYRTLADRLHRSITGTSHGGGIAVRAAFQAPEIFGRVAVLSGGIADGEQEKFTNWIAAMPSGKRPEVLVDVGDQDGIIVFTHRLTDLLDKNNYPYTFTHGPGNHDWKYFNSTLEKNLKWLVPLY